MEMNVKRVCVQNEMLFSLWGLTVLGIIIMFIKLFCMESPADIISILFCTSGLGFTYEGIKLKKKWSIICGVVFLLLAVYFFINFVWGYSNG